MWAAGIHSVVMDMISDVGQQQTPPTGTFDGEAWIVNGWGGTPADGHIAIWNKRSWIDIGELVDGTIIVVNARGLGTPAGSFANYDGKVLRYDSSKLGTLAGPWSLCASNASVIVVETSDGVNKPYTWVWTSMKGWLRAGQVEGATDGNILTADYVGMPSDSGVAAYNLVLQSTFMQEGTSDPNQSVTGFKGQPFRDTNSGDIWMNIDGSTTWVLIYSAPQ